VVDYSDIRQLVKQVLPSPAVVAFQQMKARWKAARASELPTLDERQLRDVLAERLGIAHGDVVFVHSSADDLHLQFSSMVVLTMLLDLVGPKGTLLFPTYPKLGSYEFLASGQVFDVRKTPSYTGLITELARRHPHGVRSLHPTKSVVAIGQYAREITASHHLSPYPYDRQSPYGKLLDYDAKVVGIGVSTRVLSFVHFVEDTLKDSFPVRLYHDRLFAAPCIDYQGETRIVETYAHDLRKIKHKIPAFMKAHVAQETCKDIKVDGRRFFTGNAVRLFDNMMNLARAGITIYPGAPSIARP
jgi:aminoglycoside 3-N-acetyltransferase